MDVLKDTIQVLKSPRRRHKGTKNLEKVVMIDALKEKCLLPLILKFLEIAKSSYYYQRVALACSDKYSGLGLQIKVIFHKHRAVYGFAGSIWR